MYEKTLSIADWRREACQQLKSISDTASLEADVLLSNALDKPRAWLLAHADEALPSKARDLLNNWLTRRLEHEPIAYLTGTQEFWSLTLRVTEATLIPRPETEALVERVLAIVAGTNKPRIADLGTGSGAIAIALGTERPDADIVATDRSSEALAVAADNATQLNVANVQFVGGDWCHALPPPLFNVIVSNPPYVEQDFAGFRDNLRHEPRSALASGDDGLDDIRTIARDAGRHLKAGGWLLLEHGHMQADAVSGILRAHAFNEITLHRDLAGLPRFTEARAGSSTA